MIPPLQKREFSNRKKIAATAILYLDRKFVKKKIGSNFFSVKTYRVRVEKSYKYSKLVV